MSSYECSDSVAEAQVQADEEAERSLRARYNDLLVDHARLAAQVLRVRELRDRFATHEKSISYQAAATLLTRALDGDAENTLANVRDWADRTGHYVPGQITDWQRGFLTARREVRQLLDGTDE